MVAVTMGGSGGVGAPIALWAVPRSRSTAFLRAILERGDLTVVHEPFSYLIEDGGFELAGRRASDLVTLLELLIEESTTNRRVFFKDTSDYDVAPLLADQRLYRSVVNTFIIREPRATVASHYAVNPDATLAEIGFECLHTTFEAVRLTTGQTPLVIDSDDLVANPEAMMRVYCEWVGLPFIGEAMSWKPGTQAAWQRTARWHAEVDSSSGLVANRRENQVNPDNNAHLHAMVEYHQPFYDAMYAHRIVVDPVAGNRSWP